jgi:hypothetical protein
MNVWVLVRTGVYDQGVGGVFVSLEDAVTEAIKQSSTSDRYHDWRVEEHIIGEPVTLEEPIVAPKRRAYRNVMLWVSSKDEPEQEGYNLPFYDVEENTDD